MLEERPCRVIREEAKVKIGVEACHVFRGRLVSAFCCLNEVSPATKGKYVLFYM